MKLVVPPPSSALPHAFPIVPSVSEAGVFNVTLLLPLVSGGLGELGAW